ncbi:MAG TPA: TadE/TadG family type IV pilus assembly protein [Phycisphaerae bacterium]|nr:TadE/TadG family type IV pilus assembly protein [Phycisphaerae bacterium]
METALLLPLLMSLTLVLLEYGWVFIKIQQLNSAAREGARAGARSNGTNAQISAAVDSVMTRSSMGGSSYSVTTVPANVAGADRGETIRVRVEVNYDNVTLVNVPLIPLPTTLGSEYRIMKE